MKKYWFLFFLLVIGHVAGLLTLQFTAWPEMLAYPYLLHKGFSWYHDIIQPYFPTLPYVLWGYCMLAGFTVSSLQGFTIGTIVICDIAVFLVASRLFSVRRALFVMFCYVLLQLYAEGNGMWFDMAVVPFAITSFYSFYQFLHSNRLRWLALSGLLLGIAITVKQTALWYVIAGEIGILGMIRNTKALKQAVQSSSVFIGAVLVPIILIITLFGAKEVIFWTLLFPFTVMPKIPGYILYPTKMQLIITAIILAPFFFAFLHKQWKMLFLWFAASIFFLYPRFGYFHLQPILPFVVLGIGSGLKKIKSSSILMVAVSLYVLVFGYLFVRFCLRNYHKPPRFFEPEVLAVAKFLQTTIPAKGNVFFYNTPANYFVASELVPPKPWADTFSWYLEPKGMQEGVIEGLRQANVSYVVFTPFGNGGKYALGSYKPLLIDAFVHEHFTVFATVADSNLVILQKK